MTQKMPDIDNRIPYQDFLELIGDYTKVGDGRYRFACPAHGSSNPSSGSLVVVSGEKDYKICCFSRGCNMPEIYNAVAGGYRIDTQGKQERKRTKKRICNARPPWKRQIDTIYTYTNERGEYLFEKVRFREYDKAYGEPKYLQRCKDSKIAGRYNYNLGDIEKVLYNLPEVTKSDIIVICEGEKDADIVISWGYCGTTNFDGAWERGKPKWKDTYTDHLKGKNIIIIPDPDDCGRVRGDYIQKCLAGHSQVVKLILKSANGVDVDVGDWRDNGGNKEFFDRLVMSCIENMD